MIDATQSDVEHQAVEACVGHEEIAATAEHEEAQLASICKFDRRLDVGFGGSLGEPPGWTADLEGGKGRQRDLLLKLHGRRVHEPSGW